MSNEKDSFNKHFAEEQAMDVKQKELRGKKLILEERKVEFELERLIQSDKDLALAQSANFGGMTAEQITALQNDNREYIECARNGMEFINSAFIGIVPFFRKNLILIGGKTGEGKSTTVANIIRDTIRQTDPLTGKRRRVLVITNEEKAEDIYNRVTCLIKGWHYTNHDKFTDAQVNTFHEFMPRLAENLTVVDNNFNGSYGVTTSIEGIQAIFDNLIRDEHFYDAIIIDYYQNIKYSKKNPLLDEYKVQGILANMLDNYKNVYPAPIVVMAQVNPPDEEKKVPFEYRIKGRKVITDPCTLIMEMVADRKNLRTQWIVHKSRFTEAVGVDFFTGYDRGRFVEHTPEFIAKAADLKAKREMDKLDSTIGNKEETKEKKEE